MPVSVEITTTGEAVSEVDGLKSQLEFYKELLAAAEKRAEDRDAIAEQLSQVVKVAGKLAREAGNYRVCADLLELLMTAPADLLARRDERVRALAIEEMS